MTLEATLIAIFGLIVTVGGGLFVFKGGREDRIDRKRATEIERLDKDISELRDGLDSVRRDSRLVASVAVRAIRYIEEHETGGIQQFPISDDELAALERTRPLV